jgi:hypothetical protein
MAINLKQGIPGIVADVLSAAGRSMCVEEIADELDRLGVVHARRTTREAASAALAKRKKQVGDVETVMRGYWRKRVEG